MNKWRVFAELSAAALTFVVAILIGLLAGQWLDGSLGTGATFTLLLMVLALMGAVYNLLRTIRNIDERH